MEGEVEDADGSPGYEEEWADQDQHHVCPLLPGNLPGFTDGGEASARMRGRDRKADSGIQEDNQDAWQEELDKDTHQSIGEVVVVRLPFL